MKGINFRDKLIAFIFNNFTGIENENDLVLKKVILSIQNAIATKKFPQKKISKYYFFIL